MSKPRTTAVVGEVLERSIAIGCEGKTPHLWQRQSYSVGGQSFELDVASREGDRVALFETKAKSITAIARTLDVVAYLSDYADSYLNLLLQVARHEKHLRSGLTPITSAGEKCQDLRPIKVAVSPLSFGPASDKHLASQLVLAMVNANLRASVSGAEGAIAKYNGAKQAALAYLVDLAPKNKEGLLNLHAYLIDVFWLDLGQLLYALSRAGSVTDALSPLHHVTFSTRDFWTEISIADQGHLLDGKWLPVGQTGRSQA